jgi:succinyl-diaminopimelate desuccinylase
MAVVAALDGWRRAGGCPASVWVVAEGAEELGSPGLAAGLATLARRVQPDLVLVCDTERAPDGMPSVTVSQRGHLDLAVRVETGGTPVHPGRLGGAVVDPAVVLSQVILRLTTVLAAAGRRGPRSPAHARLRGRTDAQVARAAGRRATSGLGLDRRITELPALSVLRLTADAGTRAVPVRASALLDVRLPPSVDPTAAVRRLRRATQDIAPPGVRVTVSAGAAHSGHELLPASGHLAAVDAACRATYGRPVRLVRSGGSLPAASLLAEAFRTTPMLLGLGTPDGRAHGPNEFLDLAGWSDGVSLLVRLLASRQLRAPPRAPRYVPGHFSLVTRPSGPRGCRCGPHSSV